ncbi:MAG: TIGR03619 family F420-dependent LLM class oxidoreductase [Acetobacteraceae bacterium]
MRIGIHLPQAGDQATPDRIMRHAMRAEELGLSDIWVSEHIIVPKDAAYPPSPVFYDPVVVLSWVAAVTKRVGLGTSVLVLPMRHPLPLAKELGTLQSLSNGRLILGAGVGWLEAEFDALGVPFRQRGRRMDEGIAMMRAVWTQDPVTFTARTIPAKIEAMRMLPLPSAPIPIWIGGTAERQIARAIALDGWHGSRQSPQEIAPIVARLRQARPDPNFAISMRIRWDGADAAELKGRLDAYRALGVNHVLVEPDNRERDDWDRILEGVGRLVKD